MLESEQVTREAINTVQQGVTLVLKISGLTFDAFNKAISALFRDKGGEKLDKPNYKNPSAELLSGKQGEHKVKDMVKSGELLKTVDINARFTKDFKQVARKYGINFGIVKNKPGPHHVVFQAKDADLLTDCLKDYGKRVAQMQAKRRASAEKRENFKENLGDKLSIIKTTLADKLNELVEKSKQMYGEREKRNNRGQREH